MRNLIKLLNKLSLLNSFNLTGCYPPDKTLKIPVIKSLGYDNFFEPEPWLVALLRKIIGPRSSLDCFIDVGVNVGQTLLKVKSINKSIPYIGFEPNPNCLFYLNELLRRNDFQNVTIYPFALSDNSGIIDLEFYDNNATDSSASIIPGFRKKVSQKIKVGVISGGGVSQLGYVKVGLMKIDVEGGELEVVKGMLPVIKRDRPLIICEVLPVYSLGNTFRLSRQENLEAVLNGLNYEIARISNLGRLLEINSIGIHSDINNVNYIFFPRETRGSLISKVGLA